MPVGRTNLKVNFSSLPHMILTFFSGVLSLKSIKIQQVYINLYFYNKNFFLVFVQDDEFFNLINFKDGKMHCYCNFKWHFHLEGMGGRCNQDKCQDCGFFAKNLL